MNIEISPFRFKYYYSLIKGKKPNEYMFHHMKAVNFISIGAIDYMCEYRTGLSFYENDLNRPRPHLELFNTDFISILFKIEPHMWDLPHGLGFIWEEIWPYLSVQIDDFQKLKQLYDAIKANTPKVSDFLNPEIFTPSISDYYEMRKGSGYYFPKGLDK